MLFDQPVLKSRIVKFYGAKRQVVIPKTTPNAVFYNISIKGMDQMWQAYTFQVKKFSMILSLMSLFAKSNCVVLNVKN